MKQSKRNQLAKEILLAIVSRPLAVGFVRPTHDEAVKGAFLYADLYLKKANEKHS